MRCRTSLKCRPAWRDAEAIGVSGEAAESRLSPVPNFRVTRGRVSRMPWAPSGGLGHSG